MEENRKKNCKNGKFEKTTKQLIASEDAGKSEMKFLTHKVIQLEKEVFIIGNKSVNIVNFFEEPALELRKKGDSSLIYSTEQAIEFSQNIQK